MIKKFIFIILILFIFPNILFAKSKHLQEGIDLFIQKLISLPVYLTIMVILGSILMLNTKYNRSKILNIIIGIISSVVIYYLN